MARNGQPSALSVSGIRNPRATFGKVRLAAFAALFAAASPAAPVGIYPGFIESLITDSALVLQTPLLERPGYLQSFIDPVFGTRITRITADTDSPMSELSRGGIWGDEARHHYSKDQPWNSDGTLIAIQNSANPKHLILDGETYRPKYAKCGNYSVGDDRWHPSREHPHERINARDGELMWFDVVDCVRTRSWQLPFSVNYLGGGEGNTSRDGRFVALHDSSRVFVVDMDPQPPFEPYPSQRIGPTYDASRCEVRGGCRMTWASISPSGRYVVVRYDGDHPRVFDVHPKTLALTPHRVADSAPRCSEGDPSQGFIYDLAHADLAINPFDNDEDVLIGQEHCNYRGTVVQGQLIGGLVMVRLRDGAITALTDPTNESYPHHISTRNYDRPGWVYVDYTPDPGERFSDEIVAVKLDGSKSVQRFAQKRSVFPGCYRCESHAVPSRDGRRVMWASNWSRECGPCGAASDIKAYVVDARVREGTEPINNVGNSSFEQDARGWASYEGATIARVAGGVEGVTALEVAGPPSPARFGVNDSPNWVHSVPAAGARYRAGAWVRSALHHGECRLSVREYSAGLPVGTFASTPCILSPQWQLLTVDVTAQTVGATLDVRILDVPVEASESFEVDWVTIYRLDAPPTSSGIAPPSARPVLVTPNPSPATATLMFATSKSGSLRVELFDTASRMVRRLENARSWPEGEHRLRFDGRSDDGRDLPTGLYFWRIQSADGVATRRFAILR